MNDEIQFSIDIRDYVNQMNEEKQILIKYS